MDIFEKCYAPTLASELKEQGVYPYFHALQSRQDTEEDVFAGLRPRGLCVPLVDHPAKGVVASGARCGIAHLAMEMADEQVAGTGGAVVVEVVVAIDNVLGPHIDLQGAENGFLVGIVEVENLLADGALLVFVLGAKELKGHHAQLVVGEAEDKA